jgi:CRP-like cAMP-binding protein
MKEFLPILQQVSLFEGLTGQELSGILGCLGARTVTAEKGESVFLEGDPAIFIGIVLEGAVQVLREDFYGNRSILAHVGPRELFGESYAFASVETLPVSITAVEDTKLLLLDSRRITTCCSNACAFHNQVIFNLLRLVAGKNLDLHQKIQITAQRTTRDKLMTYLLSVAKQQGPSFRIPYDRQGLADYLEVDRSGLSTEIGKLRKEGVLECEKNVFRLL